MDNEAVNEIADSSRQENKYLVTFLKKKILQYRESNAPNRNYVCFYKVPEKLLKGNEDAYTPRILSVGPFHHGKPHLQAMEHYKYRCLDTFLQSSEISLGELVKLAEDIESSVRECYNDTFDHLSSVDFSKMIMLDAIFILELLRENIRENFRYVIHDEHEHEHEHEHGLTYVPRFMNNDILHDMLLLENQLPLFVLRYFCSYMNSEHVFELLVHDYFKTLETRDTIRMTPRRESHLLEMLTNNHGHIIHGERSCRGKLVRTRSATELHEEAGVKFSLKNNFLLDVVFDSDKGIMQIPLVTVNEWTQAYFGNLIAFEQCTRGSSKLITSYVIFMDGLINTCEDVDLLVKSGIIVNSLGENQLVANLFNNLYKETDTDNRHEFYYEKLCNDLNEYSRNFWHQSKSTMLKWKRMLRRDYFSNPWSAISVIVAVILLALTTIQAVSSIIQI